MYCDYRKPSLRETTFKNAYQGQFKKYIETAVKAVKCEDSLKIRNWLIENRNHRQVKELFSNLSKAYRLAIKNKLLNHNPYEGMAEEMTNKGMQGKTQDEIESENDNDVLDKTKAYTWNEAQIILNYVKVKHSHWFNFLKFKFLTGCRTGEAIALMWCDIDWDKERVLIRRTYDRNTKKFYPLKNDKTYRGEQIRKFPMPKDGELWNLLKSVPQDEPSEIVFKAKGGKVINLSSFTVAWRGRDKGLDIEQKGIIQELIDQKKIDKYLKPYNTRHTFITHAVFDLGIDEKIVSKWCGHKVEVSNKHYQDVAIFAERINPEVPQQQSEIDLLKQQLAEQQELINRLMKNRDI